MHLVSDRFSPFNKKLGLLAEGVNEVFFLIKVENLCMEALVTVFRNLFMVVGFLFLFGILPALSMNLVDVGVAEGFV